MSPINNTMRGELQKSTVKLGCSHFYHINLFNDFLKLSHCISYEKNIIYVLFS